jgi:hypothetical protein
MTPLLSGYRFRVQARPDASGWGYEIIFTFHGLAFLYHIWIYRVWAKVSKVTTLGTAPTIN